MTVRAQGSAVGPESPIERGVVFRAAGSTWLAQEKPWDAGGSIGLVVRAYEVERDVDFIGIVWRRVSDDLVTVRVIDEVGRPVKVVDR